MKQVNSYFVSWHKEKDVKNATCEKIQTISEGVEFEWTEGKKTLLIHACIFSIVKISKYYFCNLNESKI